MAGAAAGAGSLMSGTAQLIPAVFGGGSNVDGESSTRGTSTTSQQLEIDQEGIDKIIADVLGGADGLASIFAGEQNAGIFNSSTSAQAAGDLATKLAGEIAKITAKTTSTTDQEEDTDTKSRSDEDSLFDSLGISGDSAVDKGVDVTKTILTGGLNKVFGF